MFFSNACIEQLQRQFHINLLKTIFSKRCNSCPECPNNTKFCPQTNFSIKIFTLCSISAEYADKRWIKITRIAGIETVTYSLLVCILLGSIHTLINWYTIALSYIHKLGLIVAWQIFSRLGLRIKYM